LTSPIHGFQPTQSPYEFPLYYVHIDQEYQSLIGGPLKGPTGGLRGSSFLIGGRGGGEGATSRIYYSSTSRGMHHSRLWVPIQIVLNSFSLHLPSVPKTSFSQNQLQPDFSRVPPYCTSVFFWIKSSRGRLYLVPAHYFARTRRQNCPSPDKLQVADVINIV
jgi:hypothetical protein